ncbi:MAG: DUF2071 domain-containing protein [Myxococcota bacterium]
MALPLLTARWSNLLHFTYAVDPRLLEPHVPEAVKLDVQDGRAFASIVAFDSLDTRAFGIPWPGYRNFPELSLRFSIKHGEERGVVFVRKYVPKALLAKLARLLYNEPYVAAPITSRAEDDGELVTYTLSIEVGGRTHVLSATGSHPAFTKPSESREHDIKEHEWGFGRTRTGETSRYRVEHPVWATYQVQSTRVDADFSLLYGPEWSFLASAAPELAVFAVGSAIKVFPPRGLESS